MMEQSISSPTTSVTDNRMSESEELPPVCCGCDGPIFDNALCKIHSKFWHRACLCCAVCNKELTGSCHVKDNKVYCRTDFTRLFGAKCSICQGVISPSDGVHVANDNIYHVTCFRCDVCRAKIDPGDCFYMQQDNRLLCKTDYCNIQNGATHSDSDSDDSDEGGRRHRTCINNRQVHVLTETYRVNRKPSRQDCRKLSKATGLPPRVIQVWFQNRRAKDKQRPNSDRTIADILDNIQPVAVPNSYTQLHSTPKVKQCNNYKGGRPSADNIDWSLPFSLDYMIPDSMPPNIDLSATDLKNGEVIFPPDQINLLQRRVPEGQTTTPTMPYFSWLMSPY